jgi:hypothetical protein
MTIRPNPHLHSNPLSDDLTSMSSRRPAPATAVAKARHALDMSLERARPGVLRSEQRYVVRLEDNLLLHIARAEIDVAFGAGAGQELDGKMRAPWSSSALAVNSFAPWAKDATLLRLAGISGFSGSLAFEAKCPNGVSAIPPHLALLIQQGPGIVGVESKCLEYLSPKTAEVSPAYRALASAGDKRASSRWFAALEHVPTFRQLDAYQLVKHYLGLAHCHSDRRITLVYIYWEPTNWQNQATFVGHRSEVQRFADLVSGDESCSFVSLSYAEHWRELDAHATKPAWLTDHLGELRRRYEIEI